MLWLINRFTCWLGFHVHLEHEVQRMDFQRDFRTYSNGFSSRREAEKECLIESQKMPAHGDPAAVFRVESRLVFVRYGSVRVYRGVGSRFRDAIMKADRIR